MIDALTRLSEVLQGVGNGSGILSHVLPPTERHPLPSILAGANDDFSSVTPCATLLSELDDGASVVHRAWLCGGDPTRHPRLPVSRHPTRRSVTC